MAFVKHEWHLGSYTLDLGYNPEPLKKLGDILDAQVDKTKDPLLAEHIRNMLVKFGFLHFSKLFLMETIKGKQLATHYHLLNFIVLTKAFLDAVANIINHFYQLGFIGSKIDLKLQSFRDKLANFDQDLSNDIFIQKNWIEKVVNMRDEIIHRKSPLIIYYSKADETGKQPKERTVRMPIEPVSLFEWSKDESYLKNKYGKVEQDILPFCEDWIKNSDVLLCATCQRIVNFIEKQSKST